MNLRTLLYIILLQACCLFSCRQHDSRLADIDSIMETEPATALARLDSISPGDLSSDDYAYL